MSEDRVSIQIDEHVADVRMVRADKHNALDGAMFLALRDAAGRLRDEHGVRAVVLSGEGPSFCSGLDVASFMGDGPLTGDDLLGRADGEIANLAQAVSYDWQRVPVPVIASVHGNCFGGGLQIALGADIRVAARDARLSVMEVKWGLIPDMGISHALPRLVTIDVAKELTFTGRIVDGREALDLGLVTRVADDPLAAARELAEAIAERSPDAIRSAKRLYNESWHGSTADGFALETELQRALIGSPNQIAAVQAGMTKQPGEFTDPPGAAVPVADTA
jgi:enoyl-CoA hydratase/carnithine racemase